MGKKHHQRSREEILAKRAQPIAQIPVQKKVLAPNGQTLYVPQLTHDERLRAEFDASKYMPHFGEKQRAKLAAKMPKFAEAA